MGLPSLVWNSAGFIPLEDLSAQVELWTPSSFLENVATVRDMEEMDPVFDYEVFQGREVGSKLPTAIALDEGAWDYAPIVMPVRGGVRDSLGELKRRPYFLVEGHRRRRYLNALISQGRELSHQRVLVRKSPTIANFS